MKRTMTPIAVDLFAGAGGMGEGLMSAGVRIAAAVELHPQPSLTYAFNHPGCAVLVGDMKRLSLKRLEEAVISATGMDKVDVVVGGPPCQGFSTAGRKKSDDPRNSLFHEFVKVVEHFRPRLFVLENVPGFKKMHAGRAYVQAVRLFTRLGYTVTDDLLNALAYGAPQGRLRFVMVGWLAGKVDPFEWPAKTHGVWEPTSLFDSRLNAPITVSDALEDIAFLESGYEAHRHHETARTEYQKDRRDGCDLLFNHLATRHRKKAVEIFSHIKEGGTIASVPVGIRSAKRTMARMDRNSPSNAVLALPDDLIHYRHNRIPTVREMARLQTFDDDYVIFGKRTSGFVERRVDVPQYTQVGNAVPPLLARALGKAIIKAFGADERDLREVTARRERHACVLGSSGYAGYLLAQEAKEQIILQTVEGDLLPLPIGDNETPVVSAEPLHDWTLAPNPRHGQWCPGIDPRRVPAHVSLQACENANDQNSRQPATESEICNSDNVTVAGIGDMSADGYDKPQQRNPLLPN
jgi:DNA (cytosine-5)-methyltransferase 1